MLQVPKIKEKEKFFNLFLSAACGNSQALATAVTTLGP